MCRLITLVPVVRGNCRPIVKLTDSEHPIVLFSSLPESEYHFAYRYGENGRRFVPPPTVTDFPLRDDFDAVTVADKSTLNRASWKDETGSAFDAFDYMTRCRSAPKEGLVRSVSSMTVQKPRQEGRRPSGAKPFNAERGSDAGRKRLGGTPKFGQRELVEERILEDGPTRTISVWREQVATNTSKERVPPIHIPVPTGSTNGHRHRRTRSDADSHAFGIPVSTRLMDGREIINRARNMSIDRSSVCDCLVSCSSAQDSRFYSARAKFSFEEIVQRAVKWFFGVNTPAVA